MLYPRCYVLKDIALGSLEAAGGFCDVYKARHGSLSLCMKIVRVCQGSQLDKTLQVFAAEAAIWAELHHPNILPFYGIYYPDDTQKRVSLVSPWMSNSTIIAYMNLNPTLPRKPFIYDITCGLEYLHSRDIIHGDLKGLNVLVNTSGRAIIMDFGLSTIRSDKTFRFTYTTVGISTHSTHCTSPELLDEGAHPTQASDIWALGCVWYKVGPTFLP
ncbi:kinase-like protein [Macrolepiota fuliginosa MF-IS2]|uniref:non-specific serine/threonine protein kinase n=1 Tax=Macrolepiota fuliginosa MF-IS2 TaxID=1400762 RepID=A0A9P6BW92_9AGAR|nr:kinase-like protein [Macrolepiota fuliginosa MF-IS2]